MTEGPIESKELLSRYVAGDAEAASEIFDRYVGRLIPLARSHLSKKLAARLDPEDVVQSAYRSFFVRAKAEEFRLTRAGDLWRLLAKITLHKLYGQVEKQTADKRSIQREVPGDLMLPKLPKHGPGVVDLVAMGEQLQLAMATMPGAERFAMLALLQGQSAVEIAASLNKSERTVRRLLAQARAQLEDRLLNPRVAKRIGPVALQGEKDLLSFADYTLEKLLGAGAMGKVFRARDHKNDKIVALKALHKNQQTDHRAVGQLVHEAKVLGKLDHHHIVRLLGLGQFPGGGLFLVMDCVPGENLSTRLSRGRMSVAATQIVLRQVGSALVHAHSKSIVHCDLKPANILIDETGSAVVTDFGFANFVSSLQNDESGTAVGGTEGFLAPELRHSQPEVAADVYSFGKLMLAMITGDHPSEVSEARVQWPDPGWAALYARCVETDPARRLADMNRVLEA